MTTPYEKFISAVKEVYALRSAQALLGWDQETMMPAGAGEGRAHALSALSKIVQEKYCTPEMGELSQNLLEDNNLSLAQKSIVSEFKKDRDKLVKIPPTLVEEFAHTTSLAQQVWAEARPKNDKAAFNPWLGKIIDLLRQKAECLGYDGNPYDALLDEYEPGATSGEITVFLNDLKKETVPLLHNIMDSKVKADSSLLFQPFPVSVQKAFNNVILKEMTFSLDTGRLDVSAHPFTEGIWPSDVRITTRFSETDVMSAIMGTIHEAGHGLYEQGFLPEYYGTPMAEAISLGVHESQSRLWENHVGRGEAFWKHYFPEFQALFPTQLGTAGFDTFMLSLNSVQPSLIRVEADEVTYNLHIILRFELERDLFAGNIKVEDIETVWNTKSEELLGITPDCAGNGYMQDVHWSVGLMGYFPTYSIGNMYAAQLFHKVHQEIENLDEEISRRNFHPLREWLRAGIHQHGRMYPAKKLIENATGEAPSATYYIDYLKEKYSRLYKF
ncbi:MAG: carboxypeptidase M32 [Fibrobacteria bacterium]|nr:carboxypeptidase M32 [Fibrobacteria bacterium]